MRTVQVLVIYGDRSVGDDGTVVWDQSKFFSKGGGTVADQKAGVLPDASQVQQLCDKLYRALQHDVGLAYP